MKYISLLLISAGWELINAVCVPTDICTYTDVSIEFEITANYSFIYEYQESFEYICDGDDYDGLYYNSSNDCTGPSWTIDGGDIPG